MIPNNVIFSAILDETNNPPKEWQYRVNRINLGHMRARLEVLRSGAVKPQADEKGRVHGAMSAGMLEQIIALYEKWNRWGEFLYGAIEIPA